MTTNEVLGHVIAIAEKGAFVSKVYPKLHRLHFGEELSLAALLVPGLVRPHGQPRAPTLLVRTFPLPCNPPNLFWKPTVTWVAKVRQAWRVKSFFPQNCGQLFQSLLHLPDIHYPHLHIPHSKYIFYTIIIIIIIVIIIIIITIIIIIMIIIIIIITIIIIMIIIIVVTPLHLQ